MHYPQQFIINQPQLFNLHKVGDSDPWEQEKYIPDMNECQSYKILQNSQPILNQVIRQPPQQQQIKQPQQVQQSVTISEEPSSLQETNPLAYFEYLQKKYMNASPDKDNKENSIKEQPVGFKNIKSSPIHQPKQIISQQQLPVIQQQPLPVIQQQPLHVISQQPLHVLSQQPLHVIQQQPLISQSPQISQTKKQATIDAMYAQPLQTKKQAAFDTVYTQFAEKIYNQSEIASDQQYETEKGEIVNINEILLGQQDIVKIQKKKAVIKKLAENRVSGQQSRVNKSQISNIDYMTSEEKQLEQCRDCQQQQLLFQGTFAPKINKKTRAKRRTIDEFLENQKQFQQQVEEKKNRLKDQIESEKVEQLQKPQINKVKNKSRMTKNTDISMDEKSNQSVYERLYSKATENSVNTTFQQDSVYMPQIGEKSRKIHRSEKIENLLYQDALRRQEVQKLNQDIKKHQEKMPYKKVASQNSKKILIQKFLKDFEIAMQQFFPSNCSQQEFEYKIDYLQLGEILKTLGFLQLHSCSEKPSFSTERTMLYEIWALLKGDNYGGILKRNLCILLLAIQGLYCHFPTEKENSNEGETGYFNEQTQEWEVTQDDARQLQQKFDSLYRTKLQSEEKHIYAEEEYEFKPQISETSKVLAQHYRERLLEETANLLETNELDIRLPANGKISHTDLLVIQKQAQLAEHKKRQQLQTEEELSSYSIMSKPSQTSTTGQQRALELYKLAKPQYLRCDRAPQDIEYEKSMDVCTFQPSINKEKGMKKKQKSIVAKNADKTIERMRLARKERELLNQWKSRGVPNQNIILELNQLNEQFGCYSSCGQKCNSSVMSERDERQEERDEGEKEDIEQPFSSYQVTEQTNDIQYFSQQNGTQLQQQQEEEQDDEEEQVDDEEENEQNQEGQEEQEEEENHEDNVPLLFVDVNLGPQMADRIVVYEGDSAEELAEEFAMKHNLDENLQEKLIELLNEQIRGLLTKIEEEEGSENEDDYEEDY